MVIPSEYEYAKVINKLESLQFNGVRQTGIVGYYRQNATSRKSKSELCQRTTIAKSKSREESKTSQYTYYQVRTKSSFIPNPTRLVKNGLTQKGVHRRVFSLDHKN